MEHKVDTTALDTSARAVLDLSDSVTTARDHLYQVNVHPGSFEEGVKLQSKVKSSVESYEILLGKVRNSLLELSEALEEVAKGAEQTERSNTDMAREDPFIEVWEEMGTAPPAMPATPAAPPAEGAPKTGS